MSYSHARRIPDHAVFVHVIFQIHWETKRGTCFILQMVRFRFHLLDDPPVYLGILSSLLFYTESSNHINTYFWIIPVCKLKYFLGKFFILFIYSFIFILLTFIWTVLFADLSGCVAQEISSIFYLSRKCIEISILLPLVMLPLLAAATLINGYVLPVCLTLVYIFSGFMLAPQSPCLHPLSAFSVLLNRDGEIPGVPMSPPSLLVSACYCILLWDFFSVLIAGISLKKKS